MASTQPVTRVATSVFDLNPTVDKGQLTSWGVEPAWAIVQTHVNSYLRPSSIVLNTGNQDQDSGIQECEADRNKPETCRQLNFVS